MRTSSIIMAGGNGTRFWPMSRNKLPKQFLDLDGNGTLLNQTISRLNGISDPDSIYIVGNKQHKELFLELLPDGFHKGNLMLEPFAKNTAPAIAASVTALHKAHGNHVVVILPSDQHIRDEDEFRRQLVKAVTLAKSSHQLVTLGIKPTFAATGYGYLSTVQISEDAFSLESFVEKPDFSTASQYLKDDSYYWNAGIFVFETQVMLKHIKEQMPSLYELCSFINDWQTDFSSGKLGLLYEDMPSESIDYGVMEKIKDILMVPLDCGWSDLGSWDALNNVKTADENNNIIEGNVLNLDTDRSTIVGNGKLIAAIGLHDVIIVDTEDALLICNKKDVQKIKAVVNTLKEKGMIHLL